jgi:hypothetical protein
MVVLNAPNGQLLADVSQQIPELIDWLTSIPSQPGFRYTQNGFIGNITLKSEQDVPTVLQFLSELSDKRYAEFSC